MFVRAVNSGFQRLLRRFPAQLTYQSFSFSSSVPTSAMASQTSQFYADSKAPICVLEAKEHFEKLAPELQRYAHHFSRASHYGTRVVLRQVSPESENIYDLILELHRAFGGQYTGLSVSEDVVKGYLEYASQFLSNLGNYKSFGDSKFIPRISEEQFASVVSASGSTKAKELFASVKEPLFSVKPEPSVLLGFPDAGHVTGYYKGPITKAEIDSIQAALAEKNILPENTRVFKTDDGEFQLLIASADTSAAPGLPTSLTFGPENTPLKIVYGDHHVEFTHIAQEMSEAKKYASNDVQRAMVDAYVESFTTGSMEAHKESQRKWVKDIGPLVETNIGLIETYRDPAGVRGEWEGFVAMVNQERTAKFGELVARAKEYIPLLPWSKEFEKDVFTPPDFTSLEVMTFAGSGIPAGINIPNYDDVRLTIGFKNVSLGNVLSAKAPNEKVTFIEPQDQELFAKLRGPSFEVQVGIHELLGHGTGKLLSELPDGTFNYDHENPPVSDIDGKPVNTYYKKGETWGSLFGAIAGSYEECRAECVAMYLVPNRELLRIFGAKSEEEALDIMYIAYLQMARAGLLALEFWNPESEKWGQPHMQARFSILKSFLNAGQGFVSLEYSDKENFSDLVIKLDRSKIESVGKPAVGEFLQKLHVYKCSGDVTRGTEFYKQMSHVGPEMAKFRPTVMAARLPRKQFVQANTFLEDGKVVYKEYPATEVGMIESFAERNV